MNVLTRVLHIALQPASRTSRNKLNEADSINEAKTMGADYHVEQLIIFS